MRFQLSIHHGEHMTLYNVVDTKAPRGEQPCIVAQYNTNDHFGAYDSALKSMKQHNRLAKLEAIMEDN